MKKSIRKIFSLTLSAILIVGGFYFSPLGEGMHNSFAASNDENPTVALDDTLYSVDITGVIAPVDGAYALRDVASTDFYDATASWWAYDPGCWLFPSDKFQDGKKYKVRVTLVAKSIFRFAYKQGPEYPESTVTATINGLPATVNVELGKDPSQTIMVDYTFTCGELPTTTTQPSTNGGNTNQQTTTAPSSVAATTQSATTTVATDVTQAANKKDTQSLKVSVKKANVKYTKVKKKLQKVKAITVKEAKGSISYSKVKKGSSAKLKVNKKTGVITVKKGTKKGTYKIVVKITATGDDKYLLGSKTVTVKVKVK
jgi:hypothetical protein